MKSFLIWSGIISGFLTLLFFFMTSMPGVSFSGPAPEPEGDAKGLARALERSVTELSESIGVRAASDLGRIGDTETFLERELVRMGYKVTKLPGATATSGHNLEVEILGAKRTEQIMVIGAHYDSSPGSPGANSNASGCAMLLEVARAYNCISRERTVRFVFFAQGEPPYAGTKNSGAFVYAKAAAEKGDHITTMIALDSLGYFSEEENSQKAPFPLSLYYPKKGNFVAFVGDLSSRELVATCVEYFRPSSRFPCEGALVPGVSGVMSMSDDEAFRANGFRACRLTDTGELRSKYQRGPQDTAEKLDYGRMARILTALTRLLHELGRNANLN